MSYPLSGVNFVDQLFTPTSDCALWRRCVSDGVLDGLALSSAGSSLSVAPGWLMCGGKELQLASALTVPVTGAVSGYARLLATVDLSGTSSYDPETQVATFTQAYLELEYSASRDGFASLTQGDLAGSGTKYQMVVCVMSLGAAGITGIVYKCGDAYGKGKALSLTLPAANWSSKAQTVACDGITPQVHPQASYAPASRDGYRSSGVYLYSQGDGTLTFKCDVEPAEDLTVNILLH